MTDDAINSAAETATRTRPPGPDIAQAQAALTLILGADAPQVSAIRRLGGGVSNQTYRLTTTQGDLVLRCPPPGARSGNAHDMAREAQVLAAVHPLFPKAPQPLGWSEDASATGDAFMVMRAIPGVALEPGRDAAMPAATASALCRNFVALFAALHAVTPTDPVRAVFGNPQGFVARQVAGWTRRFAAIPTGRDFSALTGWLAAHVPPEPETPSILHNDFKFDNLLLDPDDPAQINGVIDWELAGLGDPLMDLGNALAYWVEPDDPPAIRATRRGPTDAPGMMTRDELIAAYCQARGIARPATMTFYQAMGLFRLAVIALQVHMRYAKGGMDEPGPFRDGALALLDRAQAMTETA